MGRSKRIRKHKRTTRLASRLTSLVLSILLVATLLPATTFADPPAGDDPGDLFPGEILFPFNEGNGPTSSALSDGLTATLDNYVWDQSGRGGTPAISNDLTGQNGITIDYGDEFASVNDVTMGVWVKPSAPDPEKDSYLMAPPYAGTTGDWGFGNGEIWWSINWGDSESDYADTTIDLLSYGSDDSPWDGGISAPAGNLADGNWHYLAFSLSATARTIALYVDGNLIGEKDYSSLYPVNLEAYKWFGGNGYQNQSYTGLLDELSVFPSVLDDTAHEALYNRAPNTSGGGNPGDPFPGEILFPFNEGNGLTSGALSDGLTATLNNYVWDIDYNGRGGTSAISTDSRGASGLTIDYGAQYANVNDLTMGVWVKPTAPSPGKSSYLMAPPYAGSDGSWGLIAGEIWWSIGWGTSENNYADTTINLLSYGSDGSPYGSSFSAPAGNLADGDWHYLAFSFSATAKTAALYVDGSLVGDKTYTSTFPVNLQSYKWFGGGGYNESAYTGLLDELSVFTSVLDDAVHEALYNRVPNTDGTGQQDDPADTDQVGDKTYHVAKTGSDSNPGTEAEPFLTIQKAADVLLPGETVIIHEGVYEETVRPKYNGTAEYPITYKAGDGEDAVISGANLITEAWQTASNPNAVEYNADDANLWQVNVSLPMGNYRNQIFVDGEAMLPSRYPNVAKEDAYYRPNWLTYVFDGENASTGAWSTPTGKLRDPEMNQPAGTWNGAAIVGMDNRGWNLSGAEVVSSTPGWLNLANINFYELGPTGYASGNDFHYYIQNAMAALDAPYEWFYNENSETLYLQLPNGMDPSDLDVRYKAREWGLDLSSRKYIHIEGIDLNGSNLTMRGGVSNVVDNMTAKYVTEFLSPSNERGGIIVGGKNNTLINSEIGYSAGALVTVEGEGHKIVNSKLHDATTGPTLFTASITITGINHLISHNQVYNASGTLIGGSFYASEISYNDIHDGNWHSTDAGLMYFAYNDFGNSQIHHNMIHDSHSEFSNGVYFDLGCKNALVYGNVFWNLPWASVFINSSSEFISVVGNTVFQGASSHSNPEIYTNSPGDAYMDVFMNNIVDSRGVGTDNVNVGAVVMDNYSRPSDDIDGTATFNNPAAFDFTPKPDSDAVGMGAYQPGDTWTAGLKGTPVTVEEVSSGPQLLPYANKNLLFNSGFEWPRVEFPSMGSMPYWTKTGTGSATIVRAGSSADNAHARDQNAVELTGQNIGLEQEIAGLEPGTDYILRGFARMGNGSSADGQIVEIGVKVGENTLKDELDRPAWRSVSIEFTADPTGTATVYAIKTTAGSRALIDDFSVVRADITPDVGPGSDDLYPMPDSPVALLDDMLFEDSEWTVANESSFVKDEPSGLALAAQPGQSAVAFYTQEKYSNKDFYLKLDESEDLDALDMNIILRATSATRTANRYEIDVQGTTATLTRYYNGQGLELGQWTVDINDRLLKAGTVWDDVNESGYGGVTVTLKSGNETLFSVRDENNLNVSAPGYFGLATESSIQFERVTEYVDMGSVIADKEGWNTGEPAATWENNDTKLKTNGAATAGYTRRTFGDAEFVVGFESGLNTQAFPGFTLRAPTEEDLLNNPWSGTKYIVILKEESFEIQHWPDAWKPGSNILSGDGRSALADNKGFVPPYTETLVKVSTVNTDYGVWIRLKAGDTIVASWIDENNYRTDAGYFGITGYTEPMSISVPSESAYVPVIGNPDDNPDSGGTADTSALEQLISEAEALIEAEYTEESWAVLEAALDDAKAVAANDAATQEQIDEAAGALQAAINDLVTEPTPTPTSTSTSTPTPTSTPTSTPTPTPAPEIVKVDAELDGNQVARVDVNADTLAAAFKNAKNNKVTIKVDGAESAKGIDVSLPASVLSAASSQDKVEVDAGLAVLELTPAKLGGISESTSKVELSVHEVDASTLSDEAKRLIGDNKVYDFNLSVDGVKIETFDNQAVAVKLKYTPKPGENADRIIIYYIDDEGKLSIVVNGKYDAATGQVIFKPKHFSKYVPAYRAVSFNDTAGIVWATDSIDALAARNIVTGSGDGSFKPGNNVTRAEFIVMLMRSLDLIESGTTSTFTDVSAGRWYSDAIGTAQELGIVEGYPDGSFGVNENISRQEMATMLYKTALFAEVSLTDNGKPVSFQDQAAIAAYAAEAIDRLYRAGLVNGVGGDRFAPVKQATRAEAAVMIWRLFNTHN